MKIKSGMSGAIRYAGFIFAGLIFAGLIFAGFTFDGIRGTKVPSLNQLRLRSAIPSRSQYRFNGGDSIEVSISFQWRRFHRDLDIVISMAAVQCHDEGSM